MKRNLDMIKIQKFVKYAGSRISVQYINIALTMSVKIIQKTRLIKNQETTVNRIIQAVAQ